jgi:hypothetical protein
MMAANFKVLLDAQDRSESVPDTHVAVLLDTFHITERDSKPLTQLQQEWNKITNLERISWVEDQGWEYEIFLKNTYDHNKDALVVAMMLLLTKEAATTYLLRWI